MTIMMTSMIINIELNYYGLIILVLMYEVELFEYIKVKNIKVKNILKR
jgi:hypothetical protein